MSLQDLKVTKNISKDTMLWRYMTLDKLINLLSTEALYFASLYQYESTDPFEGVLPKVAMKAMRDMYLSQHQALLSQANQLRDMFLKVNTGKPEQLAAIDGIDKLIKDTEDNFLSSLDMVSFRIFKSTLVNCWHQNEFESEAMWRLYSENNKGIAIQTTFQNLVDSIDDQRIFLSEVKYMNFHDENLEPKDCVVNGYLGPLLKRKSFEHEKEVRLFFQPENDLEMLSAKEFSYKGQSFKVDISKLISKIYISPYADDLFANSVKEVLVRFGINNSQIIHSDLLKKPTY
ncbi:DUF2971 domain-containing protein [Acinetobacter pittii]|jgi:hypothetical protein|uniref:DUF2971 domain-containing protein n=1 Tax=Acinetobacter TaxID=469 RepID=UPI000F7F8078|nr:DUF2971 domain-containing protein [Acinetobacter pittii]RTA15182.1 DUF2971 domain-containing protein [Acinetobacter pittii]